MQYNLHTVNSQNKTPAYKLPDNKLTFLCP